MVYTTRLGCVNKEIMYFRLPFNFICRCVNILIRHGELKWLHLSHYNQAERFVLWLLLTSGIISPPATSFQDFLSSCCYPNSWFTHNDTAITADTAKCFASSQDGALACLFAGLSSFICRGSLHAWWHYQRECPVDGTAGLKQDCVLSLNPTHNCWSHLFLFYILCCL